MKDIVIYGSGGMAREVAALIEDINQVRPTWNILGFVDDDKGCCNEIVNGYRILGPGTILRDSDLFDSQSPEEAGISENGISEAGINGESNRNVVIAVGDPAARESIYEKIKAYNLKFPVLIHPSARVAKSVRIGEGSIIGMDCIVQVNALLGRFVFLNMRTVAGHDVIMGDYASCLVNCIVAGNVKIGRGSLLGSNCVIKEKTVIGEKARIGMGAVVCYDVADGHAVMSRPSGSMFFGERPN